MARENGEELVRRWRGSGSEKADRRHRLLTQMQAHSQGTTKSKQGSGAWQGGWRALERRDLGLVKHSRDRLAALGPKLIIREAAQQ